MSTAFEPAKNSLLPSLAARPEQLTAANTTMSTFEGTSIFLGPALAGLILALSSVQVALAMSGVLLLFSAAQVARISSPGPDQKANGEEHGGRLAEALAGFRAISADWRLRTVMGLFAAQLMVDGLLIVFIVSAAIQLLGMGNSGSDTSTPRSESAALSGRL